VLLDVCCERLENLIEGLGPIYMSSVPATVSRAPKLVLYVEPTSLYIL